MRWAALAIAAIVLAGCESTEEKSAKLEKLAKHEARESEHADAAARRGLSITHESAVVKVSATAILHGANGTAAVVTLRNTSRRSFREVPVEIVVKNAGGATLYTNTAPGLSRALVALALLPAQQTRSWVDDQVQLSGTPTSVIAKVGEGERVSEGAPPVAIVGAHIAEGSALGSVVNHSHASVGELIVYAIARRAGAIVAAGSAVVPQLEAGARAQFDAFLAGDARGAQLEVSVGGAV